MTPFKTIVQQFETACNLHKGINGFAFGTLDHLDAYSQNIEYTTAFLRLLQSPGLSGNTRQLNFELYIMDVPKLDDSERLTVLTQTEFALYDVVGYFNRGPLQQTTQVTINNIVPVNEAFQDRVGGFVANLTYLEEGIFNYCEYPS